jgi:flavin-dependent dehydrogenase
VSSWSSATGLGAHVRRRVPGLAQACPEVDAEHRCVAAQHQFEVEDRHGLASFLERRGARPGDDLAFPGIAGGYSTLTLFTRDDDVVGVLAGSIPALGVDGGAELVRRFVASQPWIGARMWGGQGAIPLRRPYTTLGAARVALLGDAACQVYSSHGSGIGIGLLAARILADAAAPEDDPGSPRVLDRYGRRFRRRHGGLLAASDAFRRYAQGLRPELLSALIGQGLLDATLAEAAITQRPARPDVGWALRTARRAARAPGLAARFASVAIKNVLLDRLGPLGGVPGIGGWADRALDSVVGRAATRAPSAEWSLPR